MITITYRIYGREGHRLSLSFNPSRDYDWREGPYARNIIIHVSNSDETGTNDFSDVTISGDSRDEIEHELRTQLEDGLFEDLRYGKVEELPAPKTLQELTGQESGIVIYPSYEMIVCNWSQLGDFEMPKVFMETSILGWEEDEDIFDSADKKDIDDFRPLIEGRNLIYDANGDIKSIRNGTYFWGDNFRATVYAMTDGTIIIAPDMWN